VDIGQLKGSLSARHADVMTLLADAALFGR